MRDWARRPAACSTGSPWSSRATDAGPEPAPARLEELILIRVANENPAIGPLRELVDDRPLERATRYREAIAGLEVVFAGEPSVRASATARSSSCCGRRRDARRPRWPASCATSATTGGRCSARRWPP